MCTFEGLSKETILIAESSSALYQHNKFYLLTLICYGYLLPFIRCFRFAVIFFCWLLTGSFHLHS